MSYQQDLNLRNFENRQNKNLIHPRDNLEPYFPLLSLSIIVKHNKSKNHISVVRYLSETGNYSQKIIVARLEQSRLMAHQVQTNDTCK